MTARQRWVEEQRGVARALGLSVAEWADALERAGSRRTELMAAAIGAATARRQGLGLVRGLDGPALAGRARALLDPEPPRVRHPVLAEAIRRGSMGEGEGVERLRAQRAAVRAPRRGSGAGGRSSERLTPDAPGADD